MVFIVVPISIGAGWTEEGHKTKIGVRLALISILLFPHFEFAALHLGEEDWKNLVKVLCPRKGGA